MTKSDKFENKSYARHAAHFNNHAQGESKETHAKQWLRKDTVNYWRHERLYKLLNPILECEPNSYWLTVGDGRYGNDAKYILEHGSRALATDISETLLKEAKESGHIEEYKSENAESLSFEDESFDYVFCKESYHHFPRPALALYEMLRVARKAVILIEPNDGYYSEKFSELFCRRAKQGLQKLLGQNPTRHVFEVSGNYVYCLSRRDIEKVASGLNYRYLVFKGINDIYLDGVEYELYQDNGPIRKRTEKKIRGENIRVRLGIMDYNILCAMIFKTMPSKKLRTQFDAEKYTTIVLPQNPYIKE